MQKKGKTSKAPEKEENEYFIALLKKNDLLFTSWKISDPKWKKKIEKEESEPAQREYMRIDILSVEGGKYKKIDGISVYGLENSWHIFLKKEHFGRKIILELSYCDKKGKSSVILKSQEINIPLSIDSLQDTLSEKEKALYELSGINLTGVSGSENTSW